MSAAAAENPPRRASLVGTARISPGSSTTGSFTVELENFQDLPHVVGEQIKSPEFSVGSYPWRLDLYPGGYSEEHKKSVGVFLHYLGGHDGVQASAEFTVTHSAHASFRVFHHLPRKKYARKHDLAQDFVARWGTARKIRRSDIQGPGALTIVAKVTVFSDGLQTTLGTMPARAVVTVPPPSLGASFRQLLDTGMLSDVALKAADDLSAVAAHKSILAVRSPVFAAMFGSTMAEASSCEVALEGVTSRVLRSLLHFLYTDELADDVVDDPVQIKALLVAADQYECPRLLALCEQRLCASVTVESSAGLLVLSEQHRAAQLKEYCLEFISQRPAEVMTTQGWQQLGTHPNLLQELFAQSSGIRKRPRDAAEDEASDKGSLTREQVWGMKVPELRVACVKLGLESTGLKAVLVARLEALLD